MEWMRVERCSVNSDGQLLLFAVFNTSWQWQKHGNLVKKEGCWQIVGELLSVAILAKIIAL